MRSFLNLSWGFQRPHSVSCSTSRNSLPPACAALSAWPLFARWTPPFVAAIFAALKPQSSRTLSFRRGLHQLLTSPLCWAGRCGTSGNRAVFFAAELPCFTGRGCRSAHSWNFPSLIRPEHSQSVCLMLLSPAQIPSLCSVTSEKCLVLTFRTNWTTKLQRDGLTPFSLAVNLLQTMETPLSQVVSWPNLYSLSLLRSSSQIVESR